MCEVTDRLVEMGKIAGIKEGKREGRKEGTTEVVSKWLECAKG